MKLVTIVGARPQFIKAAVVSRAIANHNNTAGSTPIEEIIVHTGQHFDREMSAVFFDELDIPQPQVNLGISGGSHGAMTGRMLEAIENELQQRKPDAVLVYGDTNSTLAGALAAVKLHLPVAHVEAGLRSFNRRMPEEINRVLTDHAADVLFAPTATAVSNLQREGVPESRIVQCGDVMFDAMLYYRDRAEQRSRILDELQLLAGQFILATVHRAENTDDHARLRAILAGLSSLAQELPIVLPLHPRTAGAMKRLDPPVERPANMRLIEPVGYLDMVRLESAAALIATDSGGVQKEAFFNRVPCITLRDETEWVELVEIGANRLSGADAGRIAETGRAMLQQAIPDAEIYGDGHAGEAIVRHVVAGA